jgi:biopolymer transport protein TolR
VDARDGHESRRLNSTTAGDAADQREALDEATLVSKVSAFVRANPEVPVLIGGDERVPYGRVYQAMVLMQQAGAPRVGLMSAPLEATPVRRP